MSCEDTERNPGRGGQSPELATHETLSATEVRNLTGQIEMILAQTNGQPMLRTYSLLCLAMKVGVTVTAVILYSVLAPKDSMKQLDTTSTIHSVNKEKENGLR